ncbi:MAG: hypothetical protein AB7O79_01465 [Xanthobacteraceae bacterium]
MTIPLLFYAECRTAETTSQLRDVRFFLTAAAAADAIYYRLFADRIHLDQSVAAPPDMKACAKAGSRAAESLGKAARIVLFAAHGIREPFRNISLRKQGLAGRSVVGVLGNFRQRVRLRLCTRGRQNEDRREGDAHHAQSFSRNARNFST